MAAAQAAETVETNDAWSNIYNDEGYRHILQLLPNQNIAAVAKASSYKISTNGTCLKWFQRSSKSAQE